MPKRTRLFRYEVTGVDGEMVGRLEVGAVVIDRWKGRNGSWELHNFTRKDDTYVGGWSGRLLGELTPEQYANHDAYKAAQSGRCVEGDPSQCDHSSTGGKCDVCGLAQGEHPGRGGEG